MKHIHKIVLTVFIGIIIIQAVSSFQLSTVYNPFTGKLDYTVTSNFSGDNVTADYFFGNGSQLIDLTHTLDQAYDSGSKTMNINDGNLVFDITSGNNFTIQFDETDILKFEPDEWWIKGYNDVFINFINTVLWIPRETTFKSPLTDESEAGLIQLRTDREKFYGNVNGTVWEPFNQNLSEVMVVGGCDSCLVDIGNITTDGSLVIDGITASGLVTAGEFSGQQNWTDNQNYPSACPNNNAITQLDDSVTCSDDWVNEAGDTMTGNLNMGNNNITNISIINATLYYGNGSQLTGIEAGATGLDSAYNVGENTITVDSEDVIWNLSVKDFILYPAIIPTSTYYKFPHISNYGSPFLEINRQGIPIFIGVKSAKPLIYSSSGGLPHLSLDSDGSLFFYSTGTGSASGVNIQIQASSSRWIASSGYFMFQDYLRGEWDNTHDLGTSTYEWRDLFIDGTAFIDNASIDYAEIGGGYGDTGVTIYDNGNISMNGNLIIDGTCLSEGADCSADIAELTHSKASALATTCNTILEYQETIIHNYFNFIEEDCSYQQTGEYYEYICINHSTKIEFFDITEVCEEKYELIEDNIWKKTINCINKTPTWTEEETITIPRKTECSIDKNFNLEFESGDVVCIDETDPLHIKFCDKAYDTSVLSVVNYDATMIISQRAPYPVSIGGNVPVKVQCSTPINIGDLLVSSNTQGYAQSYKTWQPTATWSDMKKVWEHTGSPFCKALESCNSGTATIRCWLS